MPLGNYSLSSITPQRDMLTVEEIKKLVEKIVSRIRPDKVMVFGSYAKGLVHTKVT